MTIEEFIEARIAKREAVAKAAAPGWAVDMESNPPEILAALGEPAADHCWWNDPVTVLRDVAAKRRALEAFRIVSVAAGVDDDGKPATVASYAMLRDFDTWELMRDCVIRPMAMIWQDHSDYQPEWSIP